MTEQLRPSTYLYCTSEPGTRGGIIVRCSGEGERRHSQHTIQHKCFGTVEITDLGLGTVRAARGRFAPLWEEMLSNAKQLTRMSKLEGKPAGLLAAQFPWARGPSCIEFQTTRQLAAKIEWRDAGLFYDKAPPWLWFDSPCDSPWPSPFPPCPELILASIRRYRSRSKRETEGLT